MWTRGRLIFCLNAGFFLSFDLYIKTYLNDLFSAVICDRQPCNFETLPFNFKSQ